MISVTLLLYPVLGLALSECKQWGVVYCSLVVFLCMFRLRHCGKNYYPDTNDILQIIYFKTAMITNFMKPRNILTPVNQ